MTLPRKTPSATSPSPQSSGCSSVRGPLRGGRRFFTRLGVFGRSFLLRFWRGMAPRWGGRNGFLRRGGDGHAVVRAPRVREELGVALDRSREDEQLPERVGLRRLDESRQRPEVERPAFEELLEQGVVLRGGRVEAVRAVGVVRVAVVGACDQRDVAVAGRPRDRGPEPDVLVERAVAGRRDDDDLFRVHVVERHLGAPVERELGLLRDVAAVRDAEDRQAVRAGCVDDRLRELAVDLVLACARRRRNGEVALDVRVVRRDDDGCVGRATPAELLHRREELRDLLDLAVRSDRAERDHPSDAILLTRSSRNRGASTSTPTCELSGPSVTCQMSTTVRPSQYRDSVSIWTLQLIVSTSVGSITCATAIAS